MASSVVRRVTLSLLQAMLPDRDSAEIWAQLVRLPFVEPSIDGLLLHDTVRDTIAAHLKAADPHQYTEFRRARLAEPSERGRGGFEARPLALHRGHALPGRESDRSRRVLPSRCAHPYRRACRGRRSRCDHPAAGAVRGRGRCAAARPTGGASRRRRFASYGIRRKVFVGYFTHLFARRCAGGCDARAAGDAVVVAASSGGSHSEGPASPVLVTRR